ncbi:MAG: helix-turn-helix domain-containing protein [Candidatus Gracilibacteria bacterium]|jgi:sugar-specific transcriptional regulator TrmB
MHILSYLKQALSKIGFTEGEAEIYCEILNAPGCDASYLKNKLKYSFAGIYKMLHALSQKGFVIPSEKKGPIIFTAVPLDKIATKLEVNSRKIQRTARKLTDLAKMAQLPKNVEIFEENDLTDFYLNIPAKIDDYIWCVGSFEAVVKFFGPQIEKDFIKNRVRKGGHASAIIFDNSSFSKDLAGRDNGENRETRFVQNGEYPLEFSYLFGNNYLTFYKDSEGAIKMVKTTSPEVARAKLIQFQKLWGNA